MIKPQKQCHWDEKKLIMLYIMLTFLKSFKKIWYLTKNISQKKMILKFKDDLI